MTFGELESPFEADQNEQIEQTQRDQLGRLSKIIADGQAITTLADNPGWKVFQRKLSEIYTGLHKQMENCKPEEFASLQARLKIVREVADILNQTKNAAEQARIDQTRIKNDQSL